MRFSISLFRSCVLLAVVLALGARPGHSQTGAALVVERANGDSAVLHPADIARLPRHTAHVTEHGRAGDYSGAWLSDLLRAAGVRVDSLRGPALGSAVLAEARDGYRVMFSLGEIAPDLGAEQVLVADRRDSAALSPEAGPYRLVLPGDARPTRGVRQLVRLTVIEPAPTRLDVASLVKPVTQTLERLVLYAKPGRWWWYFDDNPLSIQVGNALNRTKIFDGVPSQDTPRLGITGLSVVGDTARVMVQTRVHEGPPLRGRTQYFEGEYDYTEDRAFVFRRVPSGWEFVYHQFVRGADSGPVEG